MAVDLPSPLLRPRSLKSSPKAEAQWRFLQSFGDDASGEDEAVTSMEYDKTGAVLAVGDKAGRICVFKANEASAHSQYHFYTEYTAHEPDFDPLLSADIPERVIALAWIAPTPNGINLLSCNEQTIKLWRLTDKKIKRVRAKSPTASSNSKFTSPSSTIRIPKLMPARVMTTSSIKRTYEHGHESAHIHSLSVCSDGQMFLSADELRVNVWNIANSDAAFNILDITPDHIDVERTECITTARFHPTHCNLMLAGSTHGRLRLCDLRQNLHCDNNIQYFEHSKSLHQSTQSHSPFHQYLDVISSCDFTGVNGDILIARDYLTVKIWDIRSDQQPINIIPIHDYLKVHLMDLKNNNCINDRFDVSASQDGTHIVTGSYNNHIVLHHTTTNQTICMEALKDPPPKFIPNVTQMDFAKKTLFTRFHPKLNIIAAAGQNQIYIYQQIRNGI